MNGKAVMIKMPNPKPDTRCTRLAPIQRRMSINISDIEMSPITGCKGREILSFVSGVRFEIF